MQTNSVKYGALYALWLALLARVFFHAWVSEDAYITFRVIDNFMAGFGLRWNVTERVQAYTHPLWLLLHLPFTAIWDNLFHLNIALSIICTMSAIAVTLFTFREKPLWMIGLWFLLPIFLSKTFMDYSTSGLETSLSFLLFSLFGYVLLRQSESRFFFLMLSIVSALLLTNRLDHAVLIAPVWGWIFYKQRPIIWQLVVGALPLITWLSFSLFYYGFLFPNTKYAKMDTGFPLSDYLLQGLNYTFTWFTYDTSSIITMGTCLTLVVLRKKLDIYTAIGAGIALNCIYTLSIGGDYMMGRFWAMPFFASVWLLLTIIPQTIRRDYLFVAVAVLLTSYVIPTFVMDIRTICATCIPVNGRIIDARVIFNRNELFPKLWPLEMRHEGQYKFGRDGKDLAMQDPIPITTLRYVGMNPYYAGARATIIDEHALADPLLARLPAMTSKPFYVGHFRRKIPKGYEHALKTDSLDEMDPDLAKYYEKIRLLTRGDLWDSERLMTIIRFNAGQYDYYKQRYLVRQK